MSLTVRGVRGAITVDANEKLAIYKASEELLTAILQENGIAIEKIGAITFSVTADITAAFPSTGARIALKLEEVPLFDVMQPPVAGSLSLCIRILLLWNTTKKQSDIRHIYRKGACSLRPDLVQ